MLRGTRILSGEEARRFTALVDTLRRRLHGRGLRGDHRAGGVVPANLH